MIKKELDEKLDELNEVLKNLNSSKHNYSYQLEMNTLKKTNVSTQLQDIRLDITWSKIAGRYFNKSASWLYNKMNGIDGNGGEGDFTYFEKLQLKNALYDFSERIRNAADNLEV